LNKIYIATSFIAFLLVFTGVGIYSATRKQDNTGDYLLASRSINFWLTALSAFSTAHSGMIFTAIIGYTYEVGVSAMWLPLGWVFGDTIAWLFVYKKLRTASEENDSETIGAFLSNDNQKGSRAIAILSALITLAFLGTYAAAQLVAGSKALYVMFGWDYNWGIILGATIVVLYCLSGGIRASIWTDAAQAVVMMFSMLGLLIVSVIACGGVSSVWTQLEAIDPLLIDFSPSDLSFGIIPFILGWMAAGIAVLGQPHIVVRAMAIDSADNVGKSRNLYILSYIIFAGAAIGVGLTSRILMPQLIEAGSDPELALPKLAVQLLPSLVVGVILAGLFAAVISTADSQLLSCSAALTQDLFPQASKSYNLAKVGTIVSTVIIVIIALLANKNVFVLANLAWSALGSSFGPLLVLRSWKLRINSAVAIIMMLVGVSVTLIWRFVLQWSDYVIEILPSLSATVLVYAIYWLFTNLQKQQLIENK
jgi:sodium/proline symporter